MAISESTTTGTKPSANKSQGAKKATKARARRGAEARAKNMATPLGATPSKTAETTKRRTQRDAAPRNASKDQIEPGASKDTKGTATYELESSNPAKRPSRKSSRRSANHSKPDSQLKNRQTRAIRSPQARSQSRAG